MKKVEEIPVDDKHFSPFPTILSESKCGWTWRLVGEDKVMQQKIITRNEFLTLSQTTNFRSFETEKNCRWQIHIWRKWQKVFQMVRKHCGKRRNCSLRAISPFPTVFSKDLYCRHIKNQGLFGKGLNGLLNVLSVLRRYVYYHLNPFPNKPWFLRVCSTSLLKTVGEKEKLLVTSNFSFFHSVFYPSG